MMRWQWHQLDYTQVISTSLQTDNHASTSPLRLQTVFYRPNALPDAQPIKALKAIAMECHKCLSLKRQKITLILLREWNELL